MSKLKYYVYTLINPEGEIFYVGKGCYSRMYIHERTVNNTDNLPNKDLYNEIKRIKNNKEKIKYEKIFYTNNEEEAYLFEYKTIKEIGIRNLCNHFDGGYSLEISNKVKIGLKKSEKNQKRIEYIKSDEYREKCRINNLGENNPRWGSKNSEEQMDAIKKSLIGIPKSEEHKEKIAKTRRGKSMSDTSKDLLSKSLKESEKFQSKMKSNEMREKQRINTLNRQKEKEYIFEKNDNIIIYNGSLIGFRKENDLPNGFLLYPHKHGYILLSYKVNGVSKRNNYIK